MGKSLFGKEKSVSGWEVEEGRNQGKVFGHAVALVKCMCVVLLLFVIIWSCIVRHWRYYTNFTRKTKLERLWLTQDHGIWHSRYLGNRPVKRTKKKSWMSNAIFPRDMAELIYVLVSFIAVTWAVTLHCGKQSWVLELAHHGSDLGSTML